jgi:hypothetical protein
MYYKKVNLKREGITDAIKHYDNSFECIIKEENGCVKYHIKSGDEIISKLNVFYLVDGKTTVTWQECKNEELSEKIAKHIIDYCTYEEKLNVSIYIKNLEEDNLKLLLEYLVDYCGAVIEAEKNLTNGKQFKIKSIYGDSVYLNHFTNKSFNVQGTSGLMKSQVVEGLSAYLSYSEIVDATLDSYEVKDLGKSVIDELFVARLPIASGELNDTVKCIIMPVFVLERLEIGEHDSFDYSFMVFPILRGLEGCIKEIFLKFGINIGNNIGSQFQVHTNTGVFTLIEKNKNIINNSVTVEVLNVLYNYHKNNRHSIFHVDDTIITTRIIEDVNVAKSLINETFELIEKCYNAIKENNLKYLK